MRTKSILPNTSFFRDDVREHNKKLERVTWTNKKIVIEDIARSQVIVTMTNNEFKIKEIERRIYELETRS
jgi:hypothetical protein